MKLDFEPNLSSTYSADSVTSADFPADSSDVSELLQAGIKAAQEGDRSEAKNLLLQVTEAEPENENAWLWLASISEYPEELLGFLNNVLNINPENERALEWALATKALMAKTFVQRGIDAARENQNGFAKQCFLQAIASDNENETAWLWLASVSESIEEKNAYLEKVLQLNPANETALGSLGTVKKQMNEIHLPKAIAEAFAGENQAANEILDEILAQSPEMEDALILKAYLTSSFDEKISCFEKVLEVNPANELANASVLFLRSMKSKLTAEETDLPVYAENVEQFAEAPEIDRHRLSHESADETSDADFNNKNELEVFGKDDEEEEVSLLENSSMAKVSTYPEENDFALEVDDNFEVPEEKEQVLYAETLPETVQPEENDYANFYNSKENDKSESNLVMPGENDEIIETDSEDFFSVPEFENVSDTAEVDDEIARIYAEYADLETKKAGGDDVSEESDEDFPLEINGDLPSYYETADEVFPVKQEAAENNAATEPEEYKEPDSAAESYAAQEFTEQKDFSEQENPAEEKSATAEEYSAVEDSAIQDSAAGQIPAERFVCPFCKAENEPQAFVCHSCQAMLSLSDLEMLLARKEGDNEIVRRAVEAMETEKELREFNADELKFLGIGHINLKNFQPGFNYLQQAVRMNPNDVVLSSQTNALAIRLAEIEKQETIHNSMPKNKKILVVDDSATVRKLISGKLEKCGHTVLSAVDGMDALEKINEEVPDLILLDINMPRMDGYQVCKLIRGNEVTKDVPIVMISGKDGFFDKVRGRMAGTTGYITKPFGPETLMKTVETYIVGGKHSETVNLNE